MDTKTVAMGQNLLLPYLRDEHPAIPAILMFTGPLLYSLGLSENENPMIHHHVQS